MDPAWALAGAAGAGLFAGAALAARALLRPLPLRGLPVLRYQLVGPTLPGSPLNDQRVPLSRFEAQLSHLRRRGFVAVSLEEALARRRERGFLASRPVVITIDGPSDTFRSAAWPLLERSGFTAVTLFFPPQLLGERELRVAPNQRPEPLLLPEALAQLVSRGLTLGVQAATRADASPEELVARFRAGRQALAPLARRAPTALALSTPTPAALSAAREAGFEAAALLGDGVLTPRTSPFAVPRFSVGPGTNLLDLALVASRRAGDPRW